MEAISNNDKELEVCAWLRFRLVMIKYIKILKRLW